MKVDISGILTQGANPNTYIENDFSSMAIPACNLLDILPDYSSGSEDLTLEANIQLGGRILSAAAYQSGEEVKKNLIYPIAVVSGKTSPAHFTKRNGWNCFQLFYTHAGSGVLNLGNRMYELTPGSLFLLDCRPYHYFYASSDEGWNYSFILFDGGNSRYLYDLIKNNSLLYLHMAGTRIVQKLNRIFELSTGEDADFELRFHELMTQIMGGLSTEKAAVSTPVDVPVWLSRLQTYIAENYNQELRVEELAKMAYLSPSRFAHRFKEMVGESPIEYQYKLRIAHAKEYLESTDLPLNEICEKVGFHNETNFYARFKQATGLPPGKYRRQAKHDQ